MRKSVCLAVALLCIIMITKKSSAQEQVLPLRYNTLLFSSHHPSSVRSAISLPFVDDFSYNSYAPDSMLWQNAGAFVNTTFPVDPISIGVVSFDGLNGNGVPYDTVSFNFNKIDTADMLTSMPILLGALSPADSVYLSFFYQAGGIGDEPNSESYNFSNYGVTFGDSLMLEFKDESGAWRHIWAHDGESPQAFKQVLIPLTDSAFFYDDFQFRFRNYATVAGNYDQWHVDYVKLNSGRNYTDTLITDVAIQFYPRTILQNYQSMPWDQFQNYQSKEKAAEHFLAVKNNFNVVKNTSYNYQSFEKISGTPIFTSPVQGINIDAADTVYIPFSTFDIPNFLGDSVIITTKYIVGATGDNNTKNDSIDRDQLFYNYMAYDDGSAEATYRLEGSPAYLAMQYHVNQPDTLQGIFIHYSNTDVDLSQNLFSILVWKSLDVNDTLYRDDFLKPKYADSLNGFAFYRFTRPVIVTDSFYIGWQQTSFSSNVKFDVGFDLNNDASDHLFYNIFGTWHPSAAIGAVMMRPVLGQAIPFGVGIVNPVMDDEAVTLFPNPVHDILSIHISNKKSFRIDILDYMGNVIFSAVNLYAIPVSDLAAGLYFLRVTDLQAEKSELHKFIKQ